MLSKLEMSKHPHRFISISKSILEILVPRQLPQLSLSASSDVDTSSSCHQIIVAFGLIIILGFFASVKNCICYQNTILNKHQATKTNKAKQPKNTPAQKFSGSRGKSIQKRQTYLLTTLSSLKTP